MQKLFLTRRNLETLLNKLNRVRDGGSSHCTITKMDTTHKKYPCSDVIEVTALENEVYYHDRMAGDVHPLDEPKT